MSALGLDEVADQLYALPPEEFVAARDDQVRQARTAGDKALAAQLGRLRRPTSSAWVINLLARDQPELIRQLVALGEDLRVAQRDVQGATLRELTGQRQRLVTALLGVARRLADAAGHPTTTSSGYEIEQTLHAALADPDVASEVLSGRLVKPVSRTGLEAALEAGVDAELDVPRHRPGSAVSEPAPGGPAAGSVMRPRAGEDARQARRRAERDRLRDDREALEQALATAEDRFADAARRLGEAEQARAEATALVASLRQQLSAAEGSARETASEERDARRARDAAARKRDGLARRLADLSGRLAEYDDN